MAAVNEASSNSKLGLRIPRLLALMRSRGPPQAITNSKAAARRITARGSLAGNDCLSIIELALRKYRARVRAGIQAARQQSSLMTTTWLSLSARLTKLPSWLSA